MKEFLIIVQVFAYSLCHSQSLIPAEEKIKLAYEKLSADTSSKKLIQDYIFSFPSDTKTFLNVFQSSSFDQLYTTSYIYLTALKNCAEAFPAEVISKCVDIGKNLVWDADAVGDLQKISVSLAGSYPRDFISKFNTLSITEQDSLITFYADVENHRAYHIYQKLIDALTTIGEKNLADKFVKARDERIKRPDH
jgi:hypothetical protein